MNSAEFQLRGVGDSRLAVHATSSQPAWLWSVDGTRILWANPVGARLFGARSGAALSEKIFGPADFYRRQIAQLSTRLPPFGTMRLERLRGFGAALGSLMTCACTRLSFPEGGDGVLVVATSPIGRGMSLTERLHNLVEGIDTPIAAFARDGHFIGASAAARALLGFRNLSDAGLDIARSNALKDGRAETPIGVGHMVLQRVGSGADVGLVALLAARAMAQPPTPQVEPVHAPAEAAPIDAAVPIHTPAPEPLAPVVEVDPALADPVVADQGETELHEAEQIAHPTADTSAPQPVPAAALEPAVELVADEPAAIVDEAIANSDVANKVVANDVVAPPISIANDTPPPAWLDDPDHVRTKPLRFTWQINAAGHFSLGSHEFLRLLGPHTVALLDRPWNDIAATLDLDADGRVAKAIASGATWSGITLHWPADGGTRLPVDLSGLPVIDREGRLTGYRGFGICRDLEALTRLAALRRHELFADPPARSLSADIAQAGPASDAVEEVAEPELQKPEPQDPEPTHTEPPDEPKIFDTPPIETSPVEPKVVVTPADTASSEHAQPAESDTVAENPRNSVMNVVPFRPGEPKSPVLTPVENSAFNELARQLSARLQAETALTTDTPAHEVADQEVHAQDTAAAESAPEEAADALPAADAINQRDWLATPPPPARGEMARDRVLFDLMPGGVLIYRLDRLLYANPAFLARIGFPTLQALQEAGGLDALFVEPDVSNSSSTSNSGTAVRISATGEAIAPPVEARLHTISWDNDQALALFTTHSQPAMDAAATPDIDVTSGAAADAEELAAILDTTAEGIVMFDADGKINSCNRSAEALFGYDGDTLTRRHLVDLFAPESHRVIGDYLDGIKNTGVAGLLDHGREALAQVRGGGLVPLSMTMGRTRDGGPNFFAVFRDLTQAKKTETELLHARRQADRSATAKADVLARISHEVRTPLNAIIGFSEVMTDQRFGPLGNERYVEYMKDIRTSGERVIAIINDLLDLSRIETGKFDLIFTTQNLNEIVEQCVAVMQPQANRGRIIIRTSLAHLLPTVIADARALRQIALNLIGNSIHLANAGGQVIVSTALSDFGEVVLRVRDTGHGMNDNELAAAMEPFHTYAPADQASDNTGVSLSLTRALVEANRARFQIKTAPGSGTLIEVVFTNAMAKAKM